jgi:predicted 2-oxoglutarate/Fe(II)-dependent dioxygenase YbiX/peroxiredoxin
MIMLPGDPAPNFEARTGGHPAFRFDTTAGRTVVLSFFGSMRTDMARSVKAHILARHRQMFDDVRACYFAVSVDPADERDGLLQDIMPGIRHFRDFGAAASRLYGMAQEPDGANLRYHPTTLVLDRMQRVVAAIPMNESHNAELDRVIAALPEPADPATWRNAPVLELPHIFDRAFCDELIALYDAQGGRPSGFMEHVDGKTSEFIDHRRKRRSDVTIADEALRGRIRAILLRRLVPALTAAFQFRSTRIERYLIACYDGQSGGFFSAHRDNTSKGMTHRRFAVTMNLNSDYDGGDLVFPEFSPRAWRAPVGGAIVFSCSLMHEALAVRRGRRFAFLPFLHDEAAEQIRLNDEKYLSGAVINRNIAGPAG